MKKLTVTKIRNLKERGSYGDGNGLTLILTGPMKGCWRLGEKMARAFFVGRHAKLLASLRRTVRAIKQTQVIVHRVEANQRRTDKREWIMKRRERTRHLIVLGGLLQKVGLVDLTE